MRKELFSIILMLLCLSIHAQDSYTLKFDKGNYSFTRKDNVLCIETTDSKVFFSSDTKSPAFPYSPFCILRPAGCTSEEYQVELKKELIYENVDIEATPAVVPTNVIVKDNILHRATVSVKEPIIFGGNMSRGDYRYVYLKATPFVYDVEKRNLYFVPEMTITLPNTVSKVTEETREGFYPEVVDANEIAEMVINPDEMGKFYPQALSKKIKARLTSVSDPIDYLIITSNALANDFKELASWKIKKGLHTKIVTVEEIYQNISGSSNVLKIKNYLHMLYRYNGLKWVLLGGDASVVPSLMCKIKDGTELGGTVVTSTPTDLFYACFGGCFDWDYNQNRIYGELSDKISLIPNIYVCRIPVKTGTDISYFTAKLIDYESETTPDYSNYNHKMLIAATDNKGITSEKSKFRKQSERMYQHHIQPYRIGTMDCIYDNYSSIEGMSSLTPSNLFALINNGYQYIDVNCHAKYFGWSFNTGLYGGAYASQQSNTCRTILTTEACQTNRFDALNDTICLSKYLLCNPYGVITYFGSSRDGWGSDAGDVVGSTLYNARFYQNLFSSFPEDKCYNYGVISAEAKKSMISEASSNDNYNRWLMFSINPMGDPEMQIYPSYPGHFLNITITTSGTSVTVSAGSHSDCTIALTSADDGESYFSVVHNTGSHTFTNVTTPFYVTVSKPTYVTYRSELLNTVGNIIGETYVYDSESYHLDKSVPEGFTLSWSLEEYPEGGYMSGFYTPTCTLNNPNHSYLDTYLVATISKGFEFKSIAKKRVIFSSTPSMQGVQNNALNISNSGSNLHVSTNNDSSKTWDIEISNASTGRTAYKARVEGSEHSISTDGWKPGIYIVRKIENNDVQTTKITIK